MSERREMQECEVYEMMMMMMMSGLPPVVSVGRSGALVGVV